MRRTFTRSVGMAWLCRIRYTMLGVVRGFSLDIIVSYSFRSLLPEGVFTFPRLATGNAHIICLPWNRGADPNFLKKDLEPLGQVLARRRWDTPIREVAALDHDTIHGARRRRRP